MTSEGIRFDQNTVLKYSERQALANNVDPAQTPQNAASDQFLLCLPLIKHFYTHSYVVHVHFL